MGYLESIKAAVIIFPIIAFLFTIPFILHQYHKYGSINKFRVLIIYSFILYLITMYFLVILPLPSREEVANMTSRTIQLIPFSFIGDIARETNFNILDPSTYISTLSHPSVYTMLFNVVMTIPFGMYLRYYFKNNLKKTILFSFLFSLFLELTQLTGLYFIYPHPYRLFDVDDLIINTLGGIIGYFVMGIFMRFLPSRDNIDFSSLEEGKRVSGLRRITRFCLDLLLWLIFTGVLYIIFDVNYVILISLIIYYVVIPTIYHGKTLGSNFLKMRLDFPNMRLLRLFLRLLLVILYYLVIPFGLGYLFIIITRNVNISNILVFVIGAFYVLLLGIFYLVNVTNIFKRKILIYDRWVKGEYVSTIGEDNNKKTDDKNLDEIQEQNEEEL